MEDNRDVNEKILGREREGQCQREREDQCQWEEPIRRLSVLAAGLRRGDNHPLFSGKEANGMQGLWHGFQILDQFSLYTKLRFALLPGNY